MKTLLFCLLMLGHAGLTNHTTSYPGPGGLSVLTVDPAASSIDWKAEKTTGKHNKDTVGQPDILLPAIS